jgi:hypothetical protein
MVYGALPKRRLKRKLLAGTPTAAAKDQEYLGTLKLIIN